MHHAHAAALASLLALAAGCASDGFSSSQREQLLVGYTETAQQYYLMNDLDRANAQCLRGLELDPENESLLLIRGWTLLGRGKTEDVAEAQRLFERLQSGGDFRAVLGLATALERRGMAFGEAADKLASGRQITEAVDPAQRIQSYRDEAQRAWRAARQAFAEALSKQSGNADAINGAMRVATLLGLEDEARAHAEHLLTVVQQDLDYWENRLRIAGLTEAEESNVREQIRRKSRLLSATHLHAAGLFVARRDESAALPHLDAAVRLDPDRPDTYSRRAQTHKSLGHYAEAIADLDRYLQLTTLDLDHPDIRRAWELKHECEKAQRSARVP